VHLQRTLAHQAMPQLLQAKPDYLEAHSRSNAVTRFAPDFSQVAIYPKSLASIQGKLTVSSPSDIYEEEADRVSEQVMSMPETPLYRDCACGGGCPECQTKQTGQGGERVQTKHGGSGGLGQTVASPIVPQVLRSPGTPLDATTRSSMEQRFGHDFSMVRVHSGTDAEISVRDLNAYAYTVGHDIVFAAGRFVPGTHAGQRLLAHELTHVIQQQAAEPRLQLAPDPAVEAARQKAAELEKEILSPAIFSKLNRDNGDTQWRVRWIIAKAKGKPLGEARGERSYYLKKLKIALTTPTTVTGGSATAYGCSPEAAAENRKEVEDALKIEERWWSDGMFADVEETAVASGTNKTRRKGQGGKVFYVDRSDPRNIRVQMKVRLSGAAAEVESIKKLEDAIERESHAKGYYLDIVFVDTSGPDVFEFSVKFCEWANSGNWASGPTTLSHEVHHALGLGDRYDYIESHADNTQMSVEMRVYWFAEQMKKATGARDPYSKMDTSSNPLLAEDICAVAFEPGPARQKCIDERKDLDPTGIPSL